jgi:hypothetical protein
LTSADESINEPKIFCFFQSSDWESIWYTAFIFHSMSDTSCNPAPVGVVPAIAPQHSGPRQKQQRIPAFSYPPFTTKLCGYNVQGCSQPEKQIMLEKLFDKFRFDIVAVSETRKHQPACLSDSELFV